jgi:DNA-binding transcriptional LysR family regulator
VGVDPDDVQRLGWVDSALAEQGEKRRIRVFTRHYQAAMTLAEQNDLIVTLPTRATWLKRDNPRVVVRDVPFEIPALELKMAWSPLLHNNAPHRWIRQFITAIARSLHSSAPTGT